MKLPSAAALLLFPCLTLAAEKKTEARPQAEVEAAVRLQIFLDQAEFGPGKIDGHYGEFTQRALKLYREANGLPPLPEVEKPAAKAADGKEQTTPLPDLGDLDVSKVETVFIKYAVTEADMAQIGELPEEVEEQAKLKWLPYRTAAEMVAEKFHSDPDFLAELNPDIDLKSLKAGDEVKVPNVTPFLIEDLKEKADDEAESSKRGTNDVEDKEEGDSKAPAKKNGKKSTNKKDAKKDDEPPPMTVSIKIDTSLNMLKFYEGDKLQAAYPVTIGSAQTESPIGEWKVRRAYHLPHFRYDEKMLKEGERSDDFHLLRPGPNNPVGAVWIALNKKGIGIHGTNDPDSIGRSASHGCIRLANWDAVRLAARIQPGMPVSIH